MLPVSLRLRNSSGASFTHQQPKRGRAYDGRHALAEYRGGSGNRNLNLNAGQAAQLSDVPANLLPEFGASDKSHASRYQARNFTNHERCNSPVYGMSVLFMIAILALVFHVAGTVCKYLAFSSQSLFLYKQRRIKPLNALKAGV
jgi:hypothetical protein